jgi:hypothetical protein
MTNNNNTKPFALAIVLVSALLLVALIAFGWMDYNKTAEPEHSVYPLTVRVVELDHDADVVVCVDGAGNGWEFYGVEDWQIGDFASLLMDNNGTTETIYDDVITMARYAGTFEG